MIPVIGLFFLCVLPLAVFVLSLQNDARKTTYAVILALAGISVMLIITQTALPVLAPVAMALAGLVMAAAVRKNYSIELIVILPTGVILFAIVCYFIYGGWQLTLGPWQTVQRHIAEAVDLNIRIYSRLPLEAQSLKAMQESRDSMVQLFTRVFPAFCVNGVIFILWLNVLMARKILMKYGTIPVQMAELSQWRTMPWLVWLFLVSGALILVPWTYASFVGINIFLCLSLAYLLQGFAIIGYIFQKKHVPPLLRALFYFFIAIQQLLMIAIAAVGLFDIWMDFRKYFRTDPAEN